MNDTTPAKLSSIAPFFIVRDFAPSVAFYRDRLGFQLIVAQPDDEPFFGIVGRDAVRIMVKAIMPGVDPSPNHQRHPWARWDGFIHTADPDAVAAEFTARGVTLRTPLADTDDQLRGFEVEDPDGYVLFFGRPL